MKRHYPMEAYALAMVVFSGNMQNALVAGALILFISTLCHVIYDFIEKTLPVWSSRLCLIILTLSVTYSTFTIVTEGIYSFEPKLDDTLCQLFIGALIIRYIINSKNIPDYYRMLFENACALGALILIGVIRELLSSGSIHGNIIAELDFMTRNFENTAVGLLLAGIAIAILCRLFGNSSNNLDGLFVLLPVVLLKQPFLINSIPEVISIVLVIVITAFLFLSVREYIVFSRTSKEFKHLPVEMVSMSIIYFILAAF